MEHKTQIFRRADHRDDQGIRGRIESPRPVSQVRHDWRRISTNERALLITQGAVIAGSAIARAIGNRDSSKFLLNSILNKDIPLPGVDGLQLQIQKRGAGAYYSNMTGSGVSARAGVSVDDLGRFQGEAHLTLDVARWVPIFQ